MTWLPRLRGHDDDGVAEVDGAALRVGEAAVVEDLQEDVEDVAVRLLDLVEEDDGVGAPADGFGELAAFLVADVAGRRADEAGDGVRSMYSLMSMRTMASSSSKRNSARALASSVLPTPVGPRKMNEPMGRRGSQRPARARRTASDDGA